MTSSAAPPQPPTVPLMTNTVCDIDVIQPYAEGQRRSLAPLTLHPTCANEAILTRRAAICWETGMK